MNEFEVFLDDNKERMNQMVLDSFVATPGSDLEQYLYGPLNSFTANGGKRQRPLICELACLVVGGNPEQIRSIAAAIEYFHTAALIHDDIEDDSKVRRGEPCLHIKIGEGLAINAGDLALSQVTGLVVDDKTLDDSTKLKALSELTQMAARTIEGQALDIGWARDSRFDLTIDDYLEMITLKTAHYSGAVPLAVGAIVGGGSVEQVEALRDFGMAIGKAFQIQDDLMNLTGDEAEMKKDFLTDITEGKRTLMVVHALGNSPDRDELIEILDANTSDRQLLLRAVEIMDACSSLDFARDYAINLVETAKARLTLALPANEYLRLLLSMADFFIERMN